MVRPSLSQVNQTMSAGDEDIIRLMEWRGIRGLWGRGVLVKPERWQGSSHARSRVFPTVGRTVAKAPRREGIGLFCNLKGGQSD